MKADSLPPTWSRCGAAGMSVALLCLVAPPLAGQTNICGDPTHGGVIRGRIVDMDQVPIQNAGASLQVLNCRALADREGRFMLKRVPPDSYLLRASFIGYYRFDTTVVVTANDTLTLELRLARAGDALRYNCRDWPVCPELPPDTSLVIAAYHTLTWFARGLPDYASRRQCLEVQDTARRALPFVTPPGVLTADACRITKKGKSVTRASTEPAIAFRMTLWEASGDQVRTWLVARVAWNEGRAWGCDFERGADGWRASKCSSGDIEPYRW